MSNAQLSVTSLWTNRLLSLAILGKVPDRFAKNVTNKLHFNFFFLIKFLYDGSSLLSKKAKQSKLSFVLRPFPK